MAKHLVGEGAVAESAGHLNRHPQGLRVRRVDLDIAFENRQFRSKVSVQMQRDSHRHQRVRAVGIKGEAAFQKLA